MSEESNNKLNILKYNHGEKAINIASSINAEIVSLIENTNGCNNNPQKS